MRFLWQYGFDTIVDIMGIIIGLLVIITLVIVLLFKSNAATPSSPLPSAVYKRKSLLTQAERDFLIKLKLLEQYNLIVLPQVSLASVVDKQSTSKYRTELFRIIDFVIFDMDYNALLLIELNDATHTQKSRQRRDARVREIAKRAELPMITFYTNKPNKQDYVLQRVVTAIRESR